MPYGSTLKATDTITRPANTTAYAANDVISTTAGEILEFADITRTDGGSGYVVGVKVITDENGLTPTLRLHLFTSAPTAIADNAACTAPLWTNRAAYIGSVDVGPLSSGGTGSDSSYAQTDTCRLPFGSAETLYGMLETRDAFTPASAQLFLIEVDTENN